MLEESLENSLLESLSNPIRDLVMNPLRNLEGFLNPEKITEILGKMPTQSFKRNSGEINSAIPGGMSEEDEFLIESLKEILISTQQKLYHEKQLAFL